MKSNRSRSSDERPSLLLIGTQMAVGGAQKVLLDQAAWFRTRGYQVSALFLYDRDGLYPKWRDTYPFPIHNLEAFHSGAGFVRRSLSMLAGLLRLWKLLRRDRFDAVETFTLDSNLFALPVAWLAGVPVRIATHHGWAKKDSPAKRFIHSVLLKAGVFDILIAVTDGLRVQSIQEGIKPELVATIPNGIQILPLENKDAEWSPEDLKLPTGCTFLLSVGRLVHEKAYEVLIQAMDLVRKEYPDALLAIAGSGVLQARLQSLIDTLQLNEKVLLLGDRPDVADLMTHADIFVMSSRSEGMPMALLEAMGSGLPVVVTRVGGLGEVVEDGSQGVLVPAEDPQKLAEAILELLRDSALRSRMGGNARRRIEENYTVERMCRQYEKVITDLYREKKRT
ncbi:MAG TPA: glycosyltransferase family 4 protein [Anaerolineales bacterium]|nr:glycosyltransferase family 4 protein [Anaerolineales bacterium]